MRRQKLLWQRGQTQPVIRLIPMTLMAPTLGMVKDSRGSKRSSNIAASTITTAIIMMTTAAKTNGDPEHRSRSRSGIYRDFYTYFQELHVQKSNNCYIVFTCIVSYC